MNSRSSESSSRCSKPHVGFDPCQVALEAAKTAEGDAEAATRERQELRKEREERGDLA